MTSSAKRGFGRGLSLGQVWVLPVDLLGDFPLEVRSFGPGACTGCSADTAANASRTKPGDHWAADAAAPAADTILPLPESPSCLPAKPHSSEISFEAPRPKSCNAAVGPWPSSKAVCRCPYLEAPRPFRHRGQLISKADLPPHRAKLHVHAPRGRVPSTHRDVRSAQALAPPS